MQLSSHNTFTTSADSTRSTSGLTQTYLNLQNAQLGKGFSTSFSQTMANEYMSYSQQTDYSQQSALSDYLDQKAREDEDRKRDNQKIAAEDAASAMEQFKASTYDLAYEENSSLSGNFLSPYSMQGGESSSAIRFNKKEVDSLVESLGKSGYKNADVLSAIRNSAGVDGATGEQIMQNALSALVSDGTQMTKLEDQNLLSLSQKLATENMNGEAVFNSLKMYQPNQALETVSQLLQEKGSVSFTKSEISALASLLDLSSEEKGKLTGFFDKANTTSLAFDKESFDTATSSAKQEIYAKQEEFAELSNELSEQLSALETTARKRMTFEESTKQHEDKRTEHTRLQMENTVLKNVIGSFKESEAKQEALATQMELMKSTKVDGEAKSNARTEGTLPNGSSLVESSLKSALSMASATADGTGRDGANQSNTNRDTSFQNMLNTNANITNLANQSNSVKNSQPLGFTQSVFTSQVTDALSTAVKGNMTKLEVKLNPVELGALNVVLTSKNGELTATIKSEKEDTMQLINQQMDVIKRELESQGITISSIEVEVNADRESDTTFAEYQQDNELNQENGENQNGSQQAQENMQAQVDELARLRMISRGLSEGWISQDNVKPEDLEAVQEMAHNLQDRELESSLDSILTFKTYSSEADSYIKLVA